MPIAPLEIQKKVHNLVTEAAHLRAEASAILASAIFDLEEIMQLPHLSSRVKKFGSRVVSSYSLASRFDALFHSNYHKSTIDPLLSLPKENRTTVEKMSSGVIEPPRFKRTRVDDSNYGLPFFGTTALMWANPIPGYHVVRAEQ